MKKLLLSFFIAATALASKDQWRIEARMEDGFDVVTVFAASDKDSHHPLLSVKADSRSEGFKSAEEVYIQSKKKKYLITRWVYGVTGSETLKIYDLEASADQEVYKLQSMPVDVKVRNDHLVLLIPTGKEPIPVDWFPPKDKPTSGSPSAPQNP